MSVLVVQFQDDAPAAWVGEWLTAAGSTVEVRAPSEADLAGHDALVVLGGPAPANDDVPDVRAAKALVTRAAETGLPTLGICLGHQICAVALGGTVGRNPREQQLGLTPVGWLDVAAEDPLLGPLVGARRAVHWNNDVVTALPEGATLLAATAAGDVQAARFAGSVWGVQWHPEVDDRIIAPWAEEDRALHAAGHVDAVLADVRAARSELEHAWRPLVTSLVRLASG